MGDKLGLWVCPHGGGRWGGINCEKWNRPINSYSVWTRHTNTHISFGEEFAPEDVDLLSQYDYFILFGTTGRSANVINKLHSWFPNKKIVAMTDGYVGDLCELRFPEPKILDALEKVDMILGNRPDAEEWVTRLCNRPYHWLGFPIELDLIQKHATPLEHRPRGRINVYHSWKAASMMRMISRHIVRDVEFVSFKNPANEYTNPRRHGVDRVHSNYGPGVDCHDFRCLGPPRPF